MTTKQELISGIEFLVQEGKRIGSSLSDADWEKVIDQDGWRGKQALAHVASIGTIVPMFVNGMANQKPGDDAGAGVDVDQLNAGLVGARAGKSVQELVDEIDSGYRDVIKFVDSQPDEFWNRKATFMGYKDVPLIDLGMRMIVLHGLSHIYTAYSAVAFN
jgi:mycothiol maleylpyruvate isomerase-like protein